MGFFSNRNNPASQPSTPTTAQMAAQFDATRPARSIRLVKDGSGCSAVNLTKVREDGHEAIAKFAEKAGISLSKRDLSGMRAQVRLYVDHSGSMEFPGAMDYTNGNVQKMVDMALGFALQIDVDGNVPVIAFDGGLKPAVNVGLQDDPANGVQQYQDVVNRSIWRRDDMGGTRFAPIMEDIKREAMNTDLPLFVIIVTDGSPGDREAATRLIKELAGYPVFIKFLAIRPVDYLELLDDLEKTEPGSRLLDNVDSKFFDGALNDDGTQNPPPITVITPLQFADAMVDEWDTWLKAAQQHRVLV